MSPIKRRLFVGTFLRPDQQQKLGQLKEYDAQLSKLWERKVRLVNGKKLHLTWLFLGSVEETLVDEIGEKLAAIAREVQPLSITYGGTEFWPSAKSARLLVLIPHMVAPEIYTLANRIKSALRQYEYREEKRIYKPHITLARLEPGKHKSLDMPDWFPLAEQLPVPHLLDRIELIESVPERGDDGYVSLRSFPL